LKLEDERRDGSGRESRRHQPAPDLDGVKFPSKQIQTQIVLNFKNIIKLATRIVKMFLNSIYGIYIYAAVFPKVHSPSLLVLEKLNAPPNWAVPLVEEVDAATGSWSMSAVTGVPGVMPSK
jgi:hypothetical protein